MHAVNVVDHIHFRLDTHSTAITLHCRDPLVPNDRKNLVYRAAELVRDHAKMSFGLEIELEKHIPMAAGLGGGSSDAAATITGLVRLLGLDWSLSKLSQLGSQLGSDVPFFLNGSSALIRGWGQEINPVVISGERWIVLVNPSFPIETRWAYEQLSASRNEIVPIPIRLKTIETYRQFSWDEVVDIMENDFESALFPVFPALNRLKLELLSAGAQAALLSGSGATVFGVFPTEDSARYAQRMIGSQPQMQVFVIRSGSSDPSHDGVTPMGTTLESEITNFP